MSQHGAWAEWLDFFLTAISSQAADSIARIRRLRQLRDRYRAEFQTQRASARLLEVADILFQQPVFSIPQLAEALDVNYPAAQRYVAQLEQSGIVHEITDHARNRLYRADGVLDAIETPL